MTSSNYETELKGLKEEINDLLRKSSIVKDSTFQACLRLISSAILENPSYRHVSGFDAVIDDLIQEVVLKLSENNLPEAVSKLESLYKLLIVKIVRQYDSLEYRQLLVNPVKASSKLASVAKSLILRILTRQVNKNVLDYFSTHNLFPYRQDHFAQSSLMMAALR